jgi:hypothetical protein
VLPRLEFFVQTEPYVHSSDSKGANKQIHPGEVFLGAQAVLVPGDGLRPTIAVSYVRRLYESPAPELDLGTFRQSGTFLVSDDVAGFHFDANFIATEQTEFGVRRAQLANAVDFPPAEEVHHFRRGVALYAAVL